MFIELFVIFTQMGCYKLSQIFPKCLSECANTTTDVKNGKMSTLCPDPFFKFSWTHEYLFPPINFIAHFLNLQRLTISYAIKEQLHISNTLTKLTNNNNNRGLDNILQTQI